MTVYYPSSATLDNVTHTLFGVTLAQTPLRKAGPGALAVLLLSSNAPDIDIVTAFAGGGPMYLDLHRGPTHGPLGILSLAVASAALVRLANDTAHFGRLIAVGLVGVLLHVLMDVPTTYGTRILSPFSDTWFAFDWIPIIDIYLLAVLASGLVAMRWRPERRRRLVAGVLGLVVANYGLRFVAHEVAIRRAPAASEAGLEACPPPLYETWTGRPDRAFAPLACLRTHAIPTFTSPFTWRILQRLPDRYEIGELRLPGAFVASIVRPDRRDQWIRRAAATETGRMFLSFARLPAATLEQQANRIIVRIVDLRFAGNPLRLGPGDALRPRGLFSLFVVFDGTGQVLEQGLGVR